MNFHAAGSILLCNLFPRGCSIESRATWLNSFTVFVFTKIALQV